MPVNDVQGTACRACDVNSLVLVDSGTSVDAKSLTQRAANMCRQTRSIFFLQTAKIWRS